MDNAFDAVVVGAGPAGMACSAELANQGLKVAVLDEQATPGGQIYRNITRTSAGQRTILGEEYAYGLEVVQSFEQAAPEYIAQARVWQAEPTGDVYYSVGNASKKVQGAYLVLTTGAMERPVPFNGWTLPGVMTVGGMSNLYKDSALVPREPVVIAGSGPLLWLVAEHLLALDAPVAAILDTTATRQNLGAARQLPTALRRFGYLMKGVTMIAGVMRAAKKAKVPIYRNVTDLEAMGNERVEKVTAVSGSKPIAFDATTLLVHEGIIPNTSLLRQVGIAHTWNPVQRYWHPEVSGDGATNLANVFVAGDGTFVHGAKSAELKGRLTAFAIARQMHRLSVVEHRELAAPVQEELDQELYPRPFIDGLYAPRKELFHIPDDTTVCRCEGVTAGRIRELVGQGFTDHNEIKSIIRCGMGPCQGRMCGSAVLELVAETSGVAPEETRPLRMRPPIKPVSLQELANAETGGTDES